MFLIRLILALCSVIICEAIGSYLGCYQDSYPADLTDLLWDREATSVDRCLSACSCKGFKYAGLQRGYQCFCGNSYGRHGYVNENECHIPCNGNTSQICGGFHKNSVYSVSVSDCRKDTTTSSATLSNTLSTWLPSLSSSLPETATALFGEYASVSPSLPESVTIAVSLLFASTSETSPPELSNTLPPGTLAFTREKTGRIVALLLGGLFLTGCAIIITIVIMKRSRTRRQIPICQRTYQSLSDPDGSKSRLGHTAAQSRKTQNIEFENPLYTIDTRQLHI